MDTIDEIPHCRSVEPHALMEVVKSQAVVKYCNTQITHPFKSLRCNTNLNLAPSDCLTSSLHYNDVLRQALYQNPNFTSLQIASMLTDCVGEVDVVSDAENIKKLLKLPFTQNGVMSMIVHKVGNTLLLDDFDLQRFLRLPTSDDWKWLRKFVEDYFSTSENKKNLSLRDKSHEAFEAKNLLIKFLCHSLKSKSLENIGDTIPLPCPTATLPSIEPVLPEPKIETNKADPQSQHIFNRNVLWTFEDIRMLIGTDMPIFGGPYRPCVSLRLRDMSEPINVLTGVDYWLDNLMCNVPEVLMCYHLDGIVQKYELIKTEDLPYLEHSQFSPLVVRNVAQNILAFLKVNATKAGHTYWLFKGCNDDVVKLYDLTTLSQVDTAQPSATQQNDAQTEKLENPFTVSVGMLLYSMARNLKMNSALIPPKRGGTIRSLLQDCIKLLSKELYPQIVSSSHYMLADLYTPVGTDAKKPVFAVNNSDDDDEWDDEDDEYNYEYMFNKDSMATKNVSETLKELDAETKKHLRSGMRTPAPLVATLEERCLATLDHVYAGITCLQFFDQNEERFLKESEERAKHEEKQRIIHEEQHPNMAKPCKPIPLPYLTLLDKTDAKATSADDEQAAAATKSIVEKEDADDKKLVEQMRYTQLQRQQKVVLNFNTQKFGSWNVHLKLLLLEKACLAYNMLGQHFLRLGNYGRALRLVYMAIRCEIVVNKYMCNIDSQMSPLLICAGDCFFHFCNNWNEIKRYLNDFYKLSDLDKYLLIEMERDMNDTFEFHEPKENMEYLLLCSINVYQYALSLNEHAYKKDILIRLGNSYNELGVKYMTWSQEIYDKHVKQAENINPEPIGDHIIKKSDNENLPKSKDCTYLAIKSHEALRKAENIFETCSDNANLAFIHCNLGRYMRFRAYMVMPDTDMKLIKTFYDEAFEHYSRSFEILHSRKENTKLWDSVAWEYATAMYQLSSLVQDYGIDPQDTDKDSSRILLELLQKSLQLCQTEDSTRTALYQHRKALIYKRLALLHHNKMQLNAQNITKTTLQLCRNYYAKSIELLECISEYYDCIDVQLDRIALFELLAESVSNIPKKIKSFHEALDVIFSVKRNLEQVLQLLKANKPIRYTGNAGSKKDTNLNETFVARLKMINERLQYVFKNLLKLQRSTKDPKQLAEVYSQLYRTTLEGNYETGKQLKLQVVIQCTDKLIQLLQNIETTLSKTNAHYVAE